MMTAPGRDFRLDRDNRQTPRRGHSKCHGVDVVRTLVERGQPFARQWATTNSGPCRLLFVSQDVNEAAKRIANVEASHAPRFGRRAVFDNQPFRDNTLMDLVKVVDLDGQVRDWRS